MEIYGELNSLYSKILFAWYGEWANRQGIHMLRPQQAGRRQLIEPAREATLILLPFLGFRAASLPPAAWSQ
jgi:hypothetical protein